MTLASPNSQLYLSQVWKTALLCLGSLSQNTGLESFSRQWAGQPFESLLLFLVSQGSLTFIAWLSVSWVLLLHMLCTILFVSSRRVVPWYSILTRSTNLFSPLSLNSTKSSNWLSLPVLYSLMDSHYVQAKGTTWCEKTESHIQTSTGLF